MWLDRFRSAPVSPTTVELPAGYQPRATRFRLDVPVSFEEDERKYDGQGINVSDSGLLATFREPPELWTEGRVTLEAGEHYLSIRARVARVQGGDVGFAFLVVNDNDRITIKILINSVFDHPLPE